MSTHDRFKLFRDQAGAWCAAPPGFRNLLRDPVGRGPTRVEAVNDLLAHPEFVHRAGMGEWPLHPGLDAFVEVFTPDCARFMKRQTFSQTPHWKAAVRRQSFRVIQGTQA